MAEQITEAKITPQFDFSIDTPTHQISIRSRENGDSKTFSIASTITTQEIYKHTKYAIEKFKKEGILDTNIIVSDNTPKRNSPYKSDGESPTHTIVIIPKDDSPSKSFVVRIPHYSSEEVAIVLSRYFCGGKTLCK